MPTTPRPALPPRRLGLRLNCSVSSSRTSSRAVEPCSSSRVYLPSASASPTDSDVSPPKNTTFALVYRSPVRVVALSMWCHVPNREFVVAPAGSTEWARQGEVTEYGLGHSTRNSRCHFPVVCSQSMTRVCAVAASSDRRGKRDRRQPGRGLPARLAVALS